MLDVTAFLAQRQREDARSRRSENYPFEEDEADRRSRRRR